MTAEERIQQSQAIARLSEELFAVGNSMAGAEMLYGALTQVIIAIAMRRQQRYREHQHRRHFMRVIATELNDPESRTLLGLPKGCTSTSTSTTCPNIACGLRYPPD